MEIIFCGCESIQGVKKATGEAYGPFYKLYYLAPVQLVSKDTRTVSGVGYVPKDVSIDQQCFQALQTCKPLSKITLIVQPDPNNLQRTVITGVQS